MKMSVVHPDDTNPQIFYWCELVAADGNGIAARVVVFNGINDYENEPIELGLYCSDQQPTVVWQVGQYVSGYSLNKAAELSDEFRYVIFWAKDADVYRQVCNEFKLSASVDRNGNPINRTKQ